MSSKVADLENEDEDISGTENGVNDAPEKDAPSLTKLGEEQHGQEILDADDDLAGNTASRGDEDAQHPLKNDKTGLGRGNRDEEDDGYDPAYVAGSRIRLSLDKTFWARNFTVKHDILLKLTLVPCLAGLRDAMTMNLDADQVRHMQENAKLAVKLAVSCNAPAVTLARCHFYEALVNMSVGMDRGDSKAESPAYLLDQVKEVEDCVERDWAERWLAKLEGREISTTQKTENRLSLGQRVVSWGASFFSPYNSTAEKPGPSTQEDSAPEMLKRMVETPMTTKPPNFSRQSPSTQAPDSARPVMSPVTPTKQKTRTRETPGSRASQISRHLSDLYEWSPRSGEGGENLDNLSMSDWQSRPNSRFSMNSNISASPNTPSRTKEGSPRRPYPLRHRSSGVDGDGSPKSSPTAKSTLRFSYPGEKAHDEEGEDILPAPNTSKRKHNRSRSLALNLTSPSKQPKNDDNVFGDWSSPSSRRKTSIVNRLGFGRAKTEVWDPHDEAERGSPRRATFAVTQEEMEDLMEKGDSPRVMEFAGGDKRGSIGETW